MVGGAAGVLICCGGLSSQVFSHTVLVVIFFMTNMMDLKSRNSHCYWISNILIPTLNCPSKDFLAPVTPFLLQNKFAFGFVQKMFSVAVLSLALLSRKGGVSLLDITSCRREHCHTVNTTGLGL
jgi:hypothetical protein